MKVEMRFVDQNSWVRGCVSGVLDARIKSRIGLLLTERDNRKEKHAGDN
jgi:hypothetical protein